MLLLTLTLFMLHQHVRTLLLSGMLCNPAARSAGNGAPGRRRNFAVDTLCAKSASHMNIPSMQGCSLDNAKWQKERLKKQNTATQGLRARFLSVLLVLPNPA